MRALGFVLLLTVLAPLAVAQRARRCSGEVPRILVDSAAPIHRDCDVDRPARIEGAQPDFTVDATGLAPGCYIVEIEVIVDATGAAEERSMRTVRSDLRSLEDAAIARLPQLRWRPAMKDGKAVRQLVRYRARFEHATFEVQHGVTGVVTVQSRGRGCR